MYYLPVFIGDYTGDNGTYEFKDELRIYRHTNKLVLQGLINRKAFIDDILPGAHIAASVIFNSKEDITRLFNKHKLHYHTTKQTRELYNNLCDYLSRYDSDTNRVCSFCGK